MSKVFGIHEIDVNPGINEADMVHFFVNELAPWFTGEGWKISLLKGDRGERAGKYAMLYEIESVEARDRFAPPPGMSVPEDVEREMEAHKDEMEAMEKKWAVFSPTNTATHLEYTDYIVLE